MSRIHVNIALSLLVAGCVFAAGYVVGNTRDVPRTNCATFRFVNPEVACGSGDVIRKTGYTEIRGKIVDYIESEKKSGTVQDASVYFRDLERGPIMGIDELAPFAPASLLKLPLAFVFLDSAERQPEVMEKKIVYSGETSVGLQRIAPIESAEAGKDYAIKDLLRMMIAYSDNASYEALEAFILNDPNRVQLRLETFQEIGLIDPKDRVESTLTVRGYASLYRILYNISYLNAEYSELLLSWLADSPYKKGLVAGVPETITVAHKFGERNHESGLKELHDCGIVYFPENPYLLCIMTRGKDFEALERLIGTVSKMMYDEVDSRRL